MLSEWMDAKTIRNHVFWMQTDEERTRPEAWQFWNKLLPEAKSGSSWVVGMVAPSGVFVAEISARGSSMRRWNAGGGLSIRWRHPGLSSSSSGFISVRSPEAVERSPEASGDPPLHPYDKKSAENYDGLVSAAAKAITLTDRWMPLGPSSTHMTAISVMLGSPGHYCGG